MAYEVAAKAAAGAPDVLGDCMITCPFFFSLITTLLGFDWES